MILERVDLLYYLLVAIFFIVAVVLVFEQKYFKWIKLYWFLDRSYKNKISSILYLLFLIIMVGSLLDFRGEEKNIEIKIKDQKTVLVIDASASMLAEDVGRTRFKQAIFYAKHLLRNSAGHQVSIVLFSDNSKRIVPFTDDFEFLESRLNSIEALTNIYGSSNIPQALLESIQYLKIEQKNGDPIGNIVVFSDFEAHDKLFKENMPENITVIAVGVGTLKGAPIPVRDKNNNFIKYKTHRGKKIITKLDEQQIKKMGKTIKRFAYFIPLNLNIPTEKIKNFFNEQYVDKIKKTNVSLRPVLHRFVVLIAILFYFIAVVLRSKATFSCLLVLLLFSSPGFAKPKEKEMTDRIDGYLKSLKKTKSTLYQKEQLAKAFLDSKKYKKAIVLYNENMKFIDDFSLESRLNYITALLGAGKIDGAIVQIKTQQSSRSKFHEEKLKHYEDILRSNLLLALNNKGKDKKKSKSKKNKSNDQKDKKEKKDKKRGEKKETKKNKSNNSLKNKLKNKEMKSKMGKSTKKVPELLKQLLGDDRKQQKIYINKNFSNKKKNNEIKDW